MSCSYANVLELEEFLRKLEKEAKKFHQQALALFKDIDSLSKSFAEFLNDDVSSSTDSQTRSCSSKDVCVTEMVKFEEELNTKVLEPIAANLSLFANIKERMGRRRTMRKRLRSWKSGSPEKDLETLTHTLFEELSALYQHRSDFVKGPYQSLKTCQ